MRPQTNSRPRAPTRLCAAIVALVFGAFALSACSGKTYPFGKGQRFMATVTTKSPPAIYFAALHGAPRNISQKLVNQLAHQARLRNLRFSPKKTAKTFQLVGYFSATRTSSGTALAYVFDITNPKSGLRHRVAGEQVLPGHAPSNVWLDVQNHHITRIARATTESLSGWYSSQGYRVSQTAVPPPNMTQPRYAARAITTASVPTTAARQATPQLPASHNRIYRSGPRPLSADEMVPDKYRKMAARNPGIIAGVHKRVPMRLKRRRSRPGQPVRLATARPPSVLKIARARNAGYAIATVRPVTGASRTANRALAQSLRTQLIRAGIVVIDDPNRELPAITGTVTLGAARGPERKVQLTWHVYDKAGVRVGTVSQNNQVARHALPGDWNGGAKRAAAAAAQGIVQLLGQIR